MGFVRGRHQARLGRALPYDCKLERHQYPPRRAVPPYLLTPPPIWVNCRFVAPMLGAQTVTDESERELEYPQREAAFFYGLFLRGHSPDELRRDIEVPPAVLARWHREAQREPGLRDIFERIVEYRRHVLAIFESLIGYDAQTQRLQ